jgi:hypothetical protein
MSSSEELGFAEGGDTQKKFDLETPSTSGGWLPSRQDGISNSQRR